MEKNDMQSQKMGTGMRIKNITECRQIGGIT